MIGSGVTKLGALSLKECRPELTQECGASIVDYALWHSMKAEDLIDEDLSHFRCSVWMGEKNKMSVLG